MFRDRKGRLTFIEGKRDYDKLSDPQQFTLYSFCKINLYQVQETQTYKYFPVIIINVIKWKI